MLIKTDIFLYLKQAFDNLHNSQWTPSYPDLQKHVYLSVSSKHVAPFWQGLLEHSFISAASLIRFALSKNLYFVKFCKMLEQNKKHNCVNLLPLNVYFLKCQDMEGNSQDQPDIP